jgi:hypothetical protein
MARWADTELESLFGINKSFIDLQHVFCLVPKLVRIEIQEIRRTKSTMPRNMYHEANPGFVQKTQLLKLRLKAIRSGVWFRALPRIDRVLVDLTIRVAGNVRSFTLAKSIAAIVGKLESLMESKFVRAIREIGFAIALRLGLIAQKWGNAAAESWIYDERFARFLSVMALNSRELFKG